MKKWKILIVTNEKIIDDFYIHDKSFNNENFSFFNVSPNRFIHEKFSIINACDINEYKYLGKQYAESEVIYNIYKLNLFNDYDYLGILHWDFELLTLDNKRNITELINESLSTSNYISFFTAYIGFLYNQYIILDEREPNKLVGQPYCGLTNCFEYLISDYNKIFNTNIKIDNIIGNRSNICCSFLIDRVRFDKIGFLINNIIDNPYFLKFDTLNKHRFIGQMTERYLSIFSTQHKFTELNLMHHFIGGKELQKVNGY